MRRPKRAAGSRAARNLARARPMVLVRTDSRQQVVARCCPAACRQGVVLGMALAEARALCPGAMVAEFNGERSRQTLERLAVWMMRYSPKVGIDPDVVEGRPEAAPDGLLLDVTGEAALFGSEDLLLIEMARKLERAGFTARLAVAPTRGAAWALARFGPHGRLVVETGDLRAVLSPLPLAALRLPEEVMGALQQVGVERIGHLLELRRESLLTRYGEVVLRRIDQALGSASEPFTPLQLEEPLAVGQEFDGATTQLEAVTLTVQSLLAELAARLLERERGVRGLRVELARVDDPPVQQEILLGRPSRDARHLWSLLRPRVEKLHLGYGVESVVLTAFWTETIRHCQMAAWGEGESHEDQAMEELLDTLVNRWGNRGVLRVQARPSYTPEKARGFAPMRGERKEAGGRRGGGEEPRLLFADRPSVLLERPEPAEALALQPDHPPSRLCWRGEDHALGAGEGPERIVTEWWGGGGQAPSTRDYYKVQTERGAWLWVFREWESGGWFVHGLWT